MSAGAVTLLVVIVLAIILLVYLFNIYNNLVKLRNRFKNAISQIDVQLQRRYDLIPNLVETVKGYMEHERETLEAVIEARNQAKAAMQQLEANPGDIAATQGLIGAEGVLTGTLGRLFALAEAYPDLKANQSFLKLQDSIEGTENRIAVARKRYNEASRALNAFRRSFFGRFFAGMTGLEEAPYYELDEAEKEATKKPPKVKF